MQCSYRCTSRLPVSPQLDLCSNPSSLKDMGRLANHFSQTHFGMWNQWSDTDVQLHRRWPAFLHTPDVHQLCRQVADSCDPPIVRFIVSFRCFVTFIADSTDKDEAGSPCLGMLLSHLCSPSSALLCLLGRLGSKLRDCVQMCLERGQPLCPGRTCGLGVFTLALFQAVSHTACWRLSLLHDSAQPSSHKGGILRLR